MDEKERVFLSMEEAISAIRFDFRQYPSQTRLFLDLCPLVLGPDTAVVADSRYNGLWISAPGRRHFSRMRKISPPELGQKLIDALVRAPPATEVMAEICRRTFGTPVEPAKQGPAASSGFWVDTGMTHFQCRQCGRCCRELDYRHELFPADYRLWQELGRTDILERVATITSGNKTVSYAIWVEPGTRCFSAVCPWLTQETTGQWACRIHEVKPEICRQYPGSRKHARMTGCIGFGD